MQKLRSSASYLKDLKPYDPKYLPARIYLNANESPYGLPEAVLDSLLESVSEQMLHRYPDPLAMDLRSTLAKINKVSTSNVLLGNGGDELIFDIMLAYGGTGRKLLIAPPSFSSYELDAKLTDTTLVEIPRVRRRMYDERASVETIVFGVDEDAVLKRVSQGDIDVVMLASPNNPSGDVLRKDFVVALLNASDALILIDQAYVEFADPQFDMRPYLAKHKNLAILRTFSKAFALAGIRLGYLLADDELVSELCKVRQPYSVDVFSALAGNTVLSHPEVFSGRIVESIDERKRITQELSGLPGVVVHASEANFILIQVEHANRIWQRLYDENGILLRDFSSAPYLTDCLRVSVGTPNENDEFLKSFTAILGEVS